MDEKRPLPKVSAVIVSWNNASALRRCLAALERSQDRQNIEIIVVDKGSRDESPQLDTEFPNITLLRLPRNFGTVKALNIGMRTATGDFFFFLPPEVEVMPETVTGLAAQLETAGEAAAVCPMLMDESDRPAQQVRKLPLPPELYRAWREGGFRDWASPGAGSEPISVSFLKAPVMMVRANFLKGMRYIDERYSDSWWDLEVCYQIRRAGKKILFFPDIRGILHPEANFGGVLPPAARALISSDCVVGAVTFSGKHFAWTAGLQIRVRALIFAFLDLLGAFLRFRNVGFHFSQFANLLSGRKIDGTQGEL